MKNSENSVIIETARALRRKNTRCESILLVIGIDEKIHEIQKDYDELRTYVMNTIDIKGANSPEQNSPSLILERGPGGELLNVLCLCDVKIQNLLKLRNR